MEIKYKNEKFSVEISENEDGVNAMINGTNHNFKARTIAPGIMTVVINGENNNFYSAEDDEHFYVNNKGECFVFDKIKEEERTFSGNGNINSANRIEILPPMPGSIVKVLVEKEQKVSEGEALIIVEAMKMETSLYSSIDGIITEINVQAGEQVDSNKVLIVVEKKEL